jgi:4-hydroxyphenylpyruvate dioxygenase-like putative hemolysin
MYNKLDRWRALYTPYGNVSTYCEFTISNDAIEMEAKPISSKRTSIDLELAIPSTCIKSNSEIKVILSSSHGLEGKVSMSETIGINELQTQKTPKEEIPLD